MVMLAWPMMYCNALGFIPAFAIRVQNVCRRECGVMFCGVGRDAQTGDKDSAGDPGDKAVQTVFHYE